jgi:hypothetical protein
MGAWVRIHSICKFESHQLGFGALELGIIVREVGTVY